MKIRENVILMEQDEYDDYMTSGKLPASSENSQPSAQSPSITLYELNQNLMAQTPVYTNEDIERAEDIIHDWIYSGHRANYYMLLCNELSYYTIFHSVDNCLIEEDFIRELWDVCSYLGPIHDVSVDNNDAIAIWAEWKDTGCMHCFYLFPYDKGVVEF